MAFGILSIKNNKTGYFLGKRALKHFFETVIVFARLPKESVIPKKKRKKNDFSLN